jgi:hypothetical protein
LAEHEPGGGKHWEHLEKVLLDNHRKEIDQEENNWRSLPFFAAALALEFAVLFQALPGAIGQGGTASWAAAGLVGAMGLSTATGGMFLLRSIWPADFRYLASEPELVGYVRALVQANAAPDDPTSRLHRRPRPTSSGSFEGC